MKLVLALTSIVFGLIMVGCSAVGSPQDEWTSTNNGGSVQVNDENDGDTLVFITLDLNGGKCSYMASTVCALGKPLPSLPTTVYKDGFNFIGWFMENGQQISDAKGFLNGFENLTQEAYNLSKGQTTLRLIAGFEEKIHQVKVYFGNSVDTFQVKHGEPMPPVTVSGVEITGYTKGKGSQILFTDSITSDTALYAAAYKLKTTGTVNSTKWDNGFNTEVSASADELELHRIFDLGEFRLVRNLNNYSIKYYMSQNPHKLPSNENVTNLHDVWLTDEDYTGNIPQCESLSNKRIGYGAFYVKVTFADGTFITETATNFLSNMSRYDEKEMLSFSSTAAVTKVEIKLLYTLRHNNDISYWAGFTWCSQYVVNAEFKLS